jgi:hypothetical protein
MPVAKEEYLVPKHNYHVVALEYASVIASSSSNANVLKTWVCTIYLAYASTSRNSSNILNLVIRNCILYLLEDERSSMPCCSICLDDGEQSTTFLIQEIHQICSTSFAGIELHLHVSIHLHNGSLAHYFASNLKRHLTLHLH